MQLPRFYTCNDDLGIEISDETKLPVFVNITSAAVKHMHQVLRLKPGASLVLFNGAGGEYRAVIKGINKHTAEVEIVEILNRDCESPLKITLVQGVSRADRMDWTVQKAVELGVHEIQPVISARTVVNLKGEHRQRRVNHWQKVAISACEQCGRNMVPQVRQASRFRDLISAGLQKQHGNHLGFVMHHKATQGLSSVIKQHPDSLDAITLLVGPEGGLTEQEQGDAVQAGFIPVKMGPRVLRTETAAIVALSVIQSAWGDIG